MSDSTGDLAGIGALADPVRRDLYRFVCAQPHPVSREQAAGGAGVAQHQAKFHLDRLVTEGLLEAEYARVSGRTGPGAGRPAKLYRRVDREISVSLPERDYVLAGQLMAAAIAEAAVSGTPVIDALHRAAAARGRDLAAADRGDDSDGAADPSPALGAAARLLAGHGYEPRVEGDRLVMANCPFHALAQDHTELVCGMNLSLLEAMVDELALPDVRARLDPGPDRCCVVLTQS